MGIALSSIGIKTSWAVEAIAGTRPTSGYTKLPDIKSMPNFNPAPNTIESTTFDNLEFTSYIDGLKDIGGALEISANLTEELFDAWTDMVDAYDDLTGGKRLWVCFDIPNFSKSVFIPAKPSKMGVPEVEANALLETTLYITPIGEPVFEADPSYTTDGISG